MLDNIYYINSQGKKVDFTKAPFIANESDLRSYTWNIETINDRVTGFNRVGVESRTLPIVVASSSIDLINKVTDIFDYDVRTLQQGKLYVNDYYIPCYITASTSSEYSHNNLYQTRELTITSDSWNWTKEVTTTFNNASIVGGIDFPYDFPIDYSSSVSINSVYNESIVPCDFKLTIIGATNPNITIGGHSYSVECIIDSGHYLEINSKTKKIMLFDNYGNSTNYFNYRDRDSYIFEKVPSGTNSVLFDNIEKFNITLYIERSEPNWI